MPHAAPGMTPNPDQAWLSWWRRCRRCAQCTVHVVKPLPHAGLGFLRGLGSPLDKGSCNSVSLSKFWATFRTTASHFAQICCLLPERGGVPLVTLKRVVKLRRLQQLSDMYPLRMLGLLAVFFSAGNALGVQTFRTRKGPAYAFPGPVDAGLPTSVSGSTECRGNRAFCGRRISPGKTNSVAGKAASFRGNL